MACSADNRFATNALSAKTASDTALPCAPHPVWDPVTGEGLMLLPGHVNGVYAVDFHPSQPWLATTDGEGTLRLWKLTPVMVGR
ncbi:MAG: hypothetical protein R3C49_10275 [Planctomycetaceae bacterium]